jgi:hypothetical protein
VVSASDARQVERVSALQRERDELMRALGEHGPSPRAKMG